MASPYEVLGVDPDADEEAIEAAYRQRIKAAHPDQGGSLEAFQRVKAAYEAATDGASRPPIDDPGIAEQRVRDARRRARSSREPTATDAAGRATARTRFEVEYLDYDVLTDYDWAITDGDLFDRARAADLAPAAHGRVTVAPGETLLEAAEGAGFAWPFACRGGACANCAVAVLEGDMGLPVDHVLPDELTDRGIRLSCVGAPVTADTKVVYNVKHLPALEELRLPPTPFERAQAGD